MQTAVATNWKPNGHLNTPYARAGQLWDRRVGDVLVRAKNWRLAFFFAMFALLPSVLGNVYLGSQSKITPYVVEIDRSSGTATVRGPATSFQSYTPPDEVLRDYLKRFILNTRSISSDPTVIKDNWTAAYRFATSNAANTLATYAQKDNPVLRSQKERISVDIIGIVRRSKDSWQVDWRETRWSLNGQQIATDNWLGIFRTVSRVPENEEQLRSNPLRTFIDELHWSKLDS